MPSLRRNEPIFQLIDRNVINTNWNGVGTTLAVSQNVVMPQTPNGTMIFGWINQGSGNNMGQLSLTSGGSRPMFLDAPANSAQPGIYMHNWGANNLSVTNISLNADTPIWISAYGPNVPGQISLPLKTDGTPLPLATGQSAATNALPQQMQLIMKNTGPTLAIFAIIGGPPENTGNNGYVIAVNDSVNGNTGPSTGVQPPPGYYATTLGNSYAFSFNWGSSLVYVVNMSPATGSGAQVLLRAL